LRVALESSCLTPVPLVRGGAVEEYVYQLLRHLRRFGVDAEVIDANYDNDKLAYEELNGASIVKVPSAKPFVSFKERIINELLFGNAVIRYIGREGFDIVHANTAWAGFALALNKSIGRLRYRGFVHYGKTSLQQTKPTNKLISTPSLSRRFIMRARKARQC